MRPVRLWAALSSSPAVSITVKRRSLMLAAPLRRSRVTPGRSSTRARRLPTRRLNSVDLPTFGRPTMATVKDMVARPSGARRSAERRQFAVVGEEIHRVVGHDRRQMRARRELDTPERFARVGRQRHGIAGGARDHQPVADQHGPRPGNWILAVLLVL